MNKQIDKGTIIRTIVEVATLVNQVIAVIGQSSFAANPTYQVISVILTIVASAICYWYNNDWTKFALLARDIFEMLKDGKITEDDLSVFVYAQREWHNFEEDEKNKKEDKKEE